MDFEPNWTPPSNRPDLDISSAVVREANRLVSEQVPELAELFPFGKSFHTKLRLETDWIGIVVEFFDSPGIPSIGDLEPSDVERFQTAAQQFANGPHECLREMLGADYFSFSKFTYVGPHRLGSVSWSHIASHLVDWINDIVLPVVLRRNQTRVLRAVPQPPQVDIGHARASLWVLECEEAMCQGTGFTLKGTGLVTCDHVLGSKTKAFRVDSFGKKFEVSIRMREPAIDLAILELPPHADEGLEAGTADHLKEMDHLVVCGYPNYRVGDSGTMVPGLVVGFRMVAGIRRILTNAPIISGASGAPVLDALGRVIGVAVTGTDKMDSSQSTENHGIIPIDALRFLRPG